MSGQEFDVTGASSDGASEAGAAPARAGGFNPIARLAALKQGNLLLAVLFVAGIGCVYMLSLRHGPARASAQQKDQELKVESALTQLRVSSARAATGGSVDTGVLVDTFYYETRQRQIPADEMPGNPFEFKLPADNQPVPVAGRAGESESNAVGARRLSEAVNAVRQLKLQSILMGANGATAMISNNLLSEGQTIAGWTVKKIESRQVVLTWNDQTYELRMP
jgi:hypothetical protein